ncbi:hypothetical protein OSB04_025229 [Centaurea solstitialis]|uniref:Uncharacterized protein n=1 Tax=Centaurea solstitialis TaxID=347529 RepID=A0AA38W3U8_9ASTR|nr:hypothetical protein OSB04_025229 [Centaurea solstitialis]
MDPQRSDMCVRELLNAGSFSWNMDLIAQKFSSRDRDCIINLPPPSDSGPDRIVWHWSSNGIYTVKSCYRIIMKRLVENSHLFVEGDWNSIWNTKVPLKVRFFMWRACREVLPTRLNLQKKGIQISPLCPLCNNNLENVWHSFVGCPAVTPVWSESGLWEKVDQHAREVDSFADLIFRMLRENPRHIGDQFVMILWSIWQRRNDIIWKDGPRDPNTVIRRAFSVLSDWSQSRILSSLDRNVPPIPCSDKWHPPRHGFNKCNVDAATFSSNNRSGFGAIIRGSGGDFVMAKATPINFLPPVEECEARALLDAMVWVSTLGLSHVVFESDAKVVVDAIYEVERSISEFGDVIKEIRSLLQNHRNYSVHAISRQANGAAHLLARNSRFLSCPKVFLSAPHFLDTCINDVCHSCLSNETARTLTGVGDIEAC